MGTYHYACACCGHRMSKLVPPCRVTRAGLPDLDQRPGDQARRDVVAAVAECPQCRYCADFIEVIRPGRCEAVRGGDYRRLIDGPMPERVSRWRRWALVAASGGEPDRAAEALVRAAWSADDAGDDAVAAQCRVMAAEARVALASVPAVGEEGKWEAVTADLWRRAGRWVEAAATVHQGVAAGA